MYSHGSNETAAPINTYSDIHRFTHNGYIAGDGSDWANSALISSTYITMTPTYTSTKSTNWTYNATTGIFTCGDTGTYSMEGILELYNTYTSGTIAPQAYFQLTNADTGAMVLFFRYVFVHITSGYSYKPFPFKHNTTLTSGVNYKFEIKFFVNDWRINSNHTEILLKKLNKTLS